MARAGVPCQRRQRRVACIRRRPDACRSPGRHLAPMLAPTSLHFLFYAAPAEAGAAAAGAGGAPADGAGGLRVIDLPHVDRLPESGAPVGGGAAGGQGATVPALLLASPSFDFAVQPAHAVRRAPPQAQTTSCWRRCARSTRCRRRSASRCCSACAWRAAGPARARARRCCAAACSPSTWPSSPAPTRRTSWPCSPPRPTSCSRCGGAGRQEVSTASSRGPATGRFCGGAAAAAAPAGLQLGPTIEWRQSKAMPPPPLTTLA